MRMSAIASVACIGLRMDAMLHELAIIQLQQRCSGVRCADPSPGIQYAYAVQHISQQLESVIKCLLADHDKQTPFPVEPCLLKVITAVIGLSQGDSEQRSKPDSGLHSWEP